MSNRIDRAISDQLEDVAAAFMRGHIDRRTFLRGALAVGLSMPAAVAFLEACGNSTPSSTKGTLVIDTEQLGSINTLDPDQSAFVIDQFVHLQVYQSLLRIDSSDLTKPFPSLATSYTRSSDGATYRFNLQKNAVFADGTPVTADDVIFSINRNKNLKGGGQFVPADLTATAVDPHTVDVTLQPPDISVRWYLAHVDCAILNSALVKQHGGDDSADASSKDSATSWLNQNSAGSGPYMFESVDQWQQVILKANPKFSGPGPKPTYQRIVVRQTSVSSQSFDIQKGDAQVALDLTNSQANSLSGDVSLHTGLSHFIVYLGLSRDPSVSRASANSAFREAVRYGIDYNGILNIVKPSVRLGGYAPPSYLGGLPSSAAIQTDTTRAKSALANSGLSNPSIKLSFPSDNPEGIDFVTLASKIQADLKPIGIDVQLDGAPLSVMAQPYHAGKTAFVMLEDAVDFPDPVMVLDFCPSGHFGKRLAWKTGQDPDTDNLVNAAQSAVDDQSRAAAYQSLQKNLLDKGFFIPICQPANTVVTAKSISSVVVDNFHYLYVAGLT